MPSRAVLAAAAVAALALVFAGAAASAAAVPSLEGETLVPTNQRFNRAATCDAGGVSTIPIHWEGLAFGPYPGTFTEDGTVTIGPQTGFGAGRFGFALGQVLSYDVQFRIDSPAGVVTGEKHLVPPLPANPFPIVGDQQYPQNSGLCTTFAGLDILGLTGASGDMTDVRATLHYDATVDSATGGTDSGIALVEALEGTAQAGIASAGTGGGQELFAVSQTAPLPQILTLSPAAATNPVGSTHTVTATVATADERVPGVTVHFTVTGSDSATGVCTTDANGQCDFTYTGPELPGADLIEAWADSNGNGAEDAGEPTATATKAFVVPLSTPGEAHGAGRLELPGQGHEGRVSFEFRAKSSDKKFEAKCNVVAKDVKVKCLDATAIVITPTHVTIFGTATVNGQATNYRIDADDLARRGAGRDTFKIQTDSGFTAGGVVASGNVEIKD
jgi:hypothetical protein